MLYIFRTPFPRNTSGWLLLQHVETRIFVNKQDTLKQYKTSSKLNIFFKNKGLKSSIFMKFCSLKQCFLICLKMLFLWLQQPNRFKLFNSRNSFIQNGNVLQCRHENSPFIDLQNSHILIGDLRIAHNNELRKLITKGSSIENHQLLSTQN